MFSMKQGHTVLILTPPKSYQAQPRLKKLAQNPVLRALPLFSALPMWLQPLSRESSSS